MTTEHMTTEEQDAEDAELAELAADADAIAIAAAMARGRDDRDGSQAGREPASKGASSGARTTRPPLPKKREKTGGGGPDRGARKPRRKPIERISPENQKQIEATLAENPALDRPLTEMQDRFCREYVVRHNAVESYLAAGYDVSRRSATERACQLLALPGVQKRIASLQAAMRRKATIERNELVEFLADVVRTPITDVMATVKFDHKTGGYEKGVSPLLQSMRMTNNGPVFEMPNKMAAVQELARMLGFYEPEKKEIGVADDLKTMILELTGQSNRIEDHPTYDVESEIDNYDD